LTTKDPIVDLRVFRVRSYSIGVFLMTIVGFVLYGSMVLLPIMLQTLLGYPPLQAGIALAPRGIGSFFMMPSHRHDDRPRRCPQDCSRSGCHRGRHDALALDHQPERRVLGHLLAAVHPGRGHVAAVRPADHDRMDAIPREQMGYATSLFSLMRNIGGSIGIAVTGTLLARHTQATAVIYGANITAWIRRHSRCSTRCAPPSWRRARTP
jgi:DHA2 family multidrug resistance protein